jgi:phosphoribosylamine--glycine ligase
LDDLGARPRRCVFKMCASAGETFVGSLDDGRDVAALIRSCPPEPGERFVLMDHLAGIETGVGAYFNGERFLTPACLDWEHKRFFAGDMGELTGEMGTVATFNGSEPLFEASLKPLEAALREAGHVGYVNLNTIINADGVWPLELTCRFGYPGFAVLEPLQALGWGELLGSMVRGDADAFPVCSGFSLGIVLTTPPFPYSRHDVDAPVGFPIDLRNCSSEHLHLGEAGLAGGELVTAGVYGWTAVVTGTGDTIGEAQAAAYERAGQVRTANLRYRLDIGEALIGGDLQRLMDWGWLKSIPPSRIASQIVR